MKKIFLLLFITISAFGQSVTISPSNAPNTEFLRIKKDGIGLDHRSANNLVGVGTFNTGSVVNIQTHTNHPLGFTTNSASTQMVLKTNGYFGIGTNDPQYILDITQRARIRSGTNTAGIWFSKSTNNSEEGSFLGNINDSQTGIWIGNAWRFGLNESGVVNIPNLAGTGTRDLAADASGNIVVSPTQNNNTVAFATGGLAGVQYNIPPDVYFHIQNSLEEYDLGSNFTNGLFIAPSAGIYYFVINLTWQANSSGIRVIDLRKNNVSLKRLTVVANQTSTTLQQYTASYYLNANDQVSLWLFQNSNTSLSIIYPNVFLGDPVFFSGYKVN